MILHSLSCTIENRRPSETVYDSDITVFLDGIPADLSGLEIDCDMGPCFGKPELACTGECTVTLNGKTASGECVFWKDPQDTVFAACVCSAGMRRIWGLSYAGEEWLSFELDLGNTVMEMDETNNSCAIPIGAIATESSSWAKIKTQKPVQE